MWYDSTLHKFRCHQNGVTSDCISKAARTIVAGTGIVITNGDGIDGDPTIAASNTFDNGIRLAPQTAPDTPENGHIWYDSASGRLRTRENGQTIDLRSNSGLADPGANGMIKRTALNTTAPAVAGVDYLASQLIAGNPSAAIGGSSTQFLSLAGTAANGSENVKLTPIAKAGTFSSLYMRISSVQPATGNLVCSFRKNGADTPLSVTFDAGDPVGTTKTNTVESVSVAAGDLVAVGCVNSAASSSGNISGMSLVFQ
jgi:hypothetical protein